MRQDGRSSLAMAATSAAMELLSVELDAPTAPLTTHLRLRLLPEPSLPSREVSQGPQKVDPAKGRPVDVDEHELGVGGLPQEKARETRLAAGTDEKIGIGKVGRVHVTSQTLGVDVGRHLGGR